ESGPMPFVAKPLACGKQVTASVGKRQATSVENADFCDHGKLTNRLAVHVAGDMSDALVPDHCFHVFPAVFDEQRMDSRPSDLTVPEPESGRWMCSSAPCLHVRAIPIRQ